MVSWWRKCILIVNKHLQIRMYHYILTLVELALPVFVALLLAWLKRFEGEYLELVSPRLFGKNIEPQDTHYDPEDPLFMVLDALEHEITNISVVFTPDNLYTQEFVKYSNEKLNFLPSNLTVKFFGIENEEMITDSKWAKNLVPSIFIVFDNRTTLHDDLPFILSYRLVIPSEYDYFVHSVAVTFQHLIALHFMKENKGHDILSEVTFVMQRFPLPAPLRRGTFINYFTIFYFGYLMPLCFIFTVPVFVTQTVLEKQIGIKELMRLNGLPVSIQWFGFFCNSFFTMFTSASLIVLVLTNSIFPDADALIEQTSPIHLQLLFTLYVLSCISFCFFLSSLSSDATRATMLGLLFWCLSFLIPFLVSDAGDLGLMTTAEQMLFSLTPNMALFWGLRMIATLEWQDGLKWRHYVQSPTIAENIVMLEIIVMFLVDIVLYLLLGWYIDQVFPGPYGIPQPWYFLFSKSYWGTCNCIRGSPPPAVPSSESSINLHEEPNVIQRAYAARIQPIMDKLQRKTHREQQTSSILTEDFESDPTNLPKIVAAVSLTKIFKSWFSPAFIAVNKVSFNVYKGEILVLLGHNGAGKTVIISLLTGSHYPTSGDVYIRGYSILKQRNQARAAMSFCPQTGMYFPELTVHQHCKFFGVLKGLRGKLLELEVEKLLRKLKLWEERKKRGRQLSGGMLRRMQLGMAAIGHAEVMFLDEPTSGLDPEARRYVWDLLLELRSSCSIVLTTHNMEEADALGTRIIIMSQGKVICCGSPMFLRNRFGSTYMMNITKGPACKANHVLETIHKYVPSATIDRNTHTELSIALPVAATRVYPNLFREIENEMTRLDITSFGLSTAGLEEIFLKVNEAAEKKARQKRRAEDVTGELASTETSESTEIHIEMSKGSVLLWQRFTALIMKRFYYLYHRSFFFFSQFIIIAVTSTLVLMMVNKTFQRQMETPLLDAIFDESKHRMIFESHNTDGLCLPSGYLMRIPKHVKVEKVATEKNISLEILTFAKNDLKAYIKGYYVLGAKFTNGENGTVLANALYFKDVDDRILFYKFVSLLLIHNAVLANCEQKSRSILFDIEIVTIQKGGKSVPFTPDYVIAIKYLQNSLAAVLLTTGLSLHCCCFIFLPTHERLVQAKHLQLMTGTGRFLFWAAAFLFDYCFYLFSVSFCIVILTLFAKDSIISQPEVPGLMFLGMFLFGLSAIPFSYLISCYPRSVTGAYVGALVIHLLSAVLFGVGHEALYVYYRRDGHAVPDWLAYASIIPEFLPGCCLAVLLIRIWMNAMFGQLKICWNFCAEYLSTGGGGSGRQLIILFLSSILYILLMFLLEIRSPNRARRVKKYLKRTESDHVSSLVDRDVKAEGERVRDFIRHHPHIAHPASTGVSNQSSSNSSLSSIEIQEDVLLVDGLTKRFTRDTVSVNHLTFGVKQDECFGLLGVNGAGKTTTFRMLTGLLTITSGNAYLRGVSLIDNQTKFLAQLGYCPQFDAMIDHLTARETLLLYAHLRGVKEKHVKKLVDSYLNQFGLKPYAYKITANYSLGTKRRLSAAVAFIGSPALVMMDEPTTGVDPASRRKIWEVILANVARGTSIILTSHSMDECEVLCSRLAIMQKGQFKCIGAVQHLKATFGKGFKVHIKLKKLSDPTASMQLHDEVENFMKRTFENCVKRDDHEGLLEYSVPYESTNWQKLFTVMEQAMDSFDLDDYSVCQATLEQVFLMFAFEDSDK